jgi:hypothetical protein
MAPKIGVDELLKEILKFYIKSLKIPLQLSDNGRQLWYSGLSGTGDCGSSARLVG